MVMQTIQIRLTKKLVEKLDELVKEGYYPNKSEAVRDAVRQLVLEHELGELNEELKEGDMEEVTEHIKEMKKYCH
ncbi:ribbon-helix-helix protein, CopG family [Candidatus Woesearchaeota archaeon]|jgi:antitoxin ParD1/3/4|nr:ribbon-helix-helix protein, CopG family [Candidatus Woesearchaeota archaeon]